MKAIIQGKHNQEKGIKRAPRMAMTTPVLKLVKLLLKKKRMNQEDRRPIWAVSCMAFHGSFRIHEMLSRNGKEFDPTTTLLGCDVGLHTVSIEGKTEDILRVHLKHPKEDYLGKGVTVELFGTGTFSCPLNAYKKWRNVAKGSITKSLPVFCLANGECYTGDKFNKDIKALLGRSINYDEKRYLSHSFR